MNKNQAERADKLLIDSYYNWNKMYLYSRREHFLESELEIFEVLYNYMKILLDTTCFEKLTILN